MTIKIRPGRGLVGTAGLAFAVTILSLAWTPLVWLPLPLTAGVLVFLFLDYRYLTSVCSVLKVKRGQPAFVGRGVSFDATLTLKNESEGLVWVEMRDVLPVPAEPQSALWKIVMEPQGERQFIRSYRISERGKFRFGPVWFRFRGQFGMLEGQVEQACQADLGVLPESAVSREGLADLRRAEAILADKLTRSLRSGEGTEFESLSEFRQGDDPRRIDWRSSARHTHLVIRKFQIEHHRDVLLLLDCGRLMGSDTGQGTKLDRAVDSLLMLSRVTLDNGDRCGLGLFDDRVRGFIPPMGGKKAASVIREQVYAVQSEWRETNFGPMFAILQTRQVKRSLVVIFSDLVDADTSVQYRAAVARLARRHLVIFAALRTPLLGAIVRAPVDSMLEVSRKAVAFRLCRQREKALHALDRSGAHVLDLEPHELTTPLLNKYIELRERNML